jgi:hypothetical protein
MYTGKDDTMWLERGHGSDLEPTILDRMLSKLSVDPSSSDFINPLARCMPIFLDPTAKSQLLREMPTLDDIHITTRHTGNKSRGVHILGTDVASSRRSADAASGLDKRKEKVAPSESASKVRSQSPSSDVEVSSEEIVPLQRKKRLIHSDGSVVGGPPLSGQ